MPCRPVSLRMMEIPISETRAMGIRGTGTPVTISRSGLPDPGVPDVEAALRAAPRLAEGAAGVEKLLRTREATGRDSAPRSQ